MKIVFICGSQEQGRDGVGDYTRRLACALIEQGHQAVIIAIGDKHIQEEWQGWQEDNKVNIAVLRLPNHFSWNKRLSTAKTYIDSFDPDWISLQFVLYTFEKKGLPFGLSNRLKGLSNGKAKWQIMFHELWIALDEKAALRQKVVGYVQKKILSSFMKRFKPLVVHTHAHIYQTKLKSLHYDVKQLPLFTNLRIDETIFEPSEKSKKEELKSTVILSIFGSIHPQSPVTSFVDELSEYAASKNIKTEVRIIGRTGKEQEIWLKALQAKKIKTKVTGELSAVDITKELYTSHYGLSTTPKLLANKSSSVATMLGHHLPVICLAKPHEFSGIKETNSTRYILEYVPGNLVSLLNTPYQKTKVPTLGEVSLQFVNDLRKKE